MTFLYIALREGMRERLVDFLRFVQPPEAYYEVQKGQRRWVAGIS